jgi:phosphatidylglycerol:prolipoprotein diacylglycerol transferase
VGIGYLAFGWLTMGQVLSLPMLLLGVWLWVVAYRQNTPSGNFVAVR